MSSELFHYQQFLETMPDAALLVNSHGTLIAANTIAHTLFQYTPSTLIGRPLEILLPQRAHATHATYLKAFFTQQGTRQMGQGIDLNGQRSTGALFPVDIMLRTVNLDGERYALSVIRDVSERKKLENSLKEALEAARRYALTDSLTGLANSRAFYEHLQHEINRLRRDLHPFCIAYVDLDNFKPLNDLFGHHAGDEALSTVAAEMRHQLRATDIPARLGGDEFAILLSDTNLDGARGALEKLRHSMLLCMRKKEWPITFSIGVICCQNADMLPNQVELIKQADRLMYRVKHEGKNGIAFDHYLAP